MGTGGKEKRHTTRDLPTHVVSFHVTQCDRTPASPAGRPPASAELDGAPCETQLDPPGRVWTLEGCAELCASRDSFVHFGCRRVFEIMPCAVSCLRS